MFYWYLSCTWFVLITLSSMLIVLGFVSKMLYMSEDRYLSWNAMVWVKLSVAHYPSICGSFSLPRNDLCGWCMHLVWCTLDVEVYMLGEFIKLRCKFRDKFKVTILKSISTFSIQNWCMFVYEELSKILPFYNSSITPKLC